MFNLTIFWVRKNSIFLFEHRILVNIKRWIICWVFYNRFFKLTYAFCLSNSSLVPFTNTVVIAVNVQPGHQRDRKMSENSISLCKNFVALININIISLICQLFIYQLTTIFLAKYQLLTLFAPSFNSGVVPESNLIQCSYSSQYSGKRWRKWRRIVNSSVNCCM